MRGWLNLKGLKEPDWLRFRFRLATITTTTITTAGIIITTIITITTIIITRAYKEKGAFTRTSLFPCLVCGALPSAFLISSFGLIGRWPIVLWLS
jgi:hypothetical protein